MRFCDLFIEYKIKLKEINRSNKHNNKLLPYQKITLTLFLICCIASAFLLVLLRNNLLIALVPLTIGFILLVVKYIIDSRKTNMETMLNNNCKPYSKRRMDMTIGVLKNYGINIDNPNALNMLIAEAKFERITWDFLSPYKKALRPLCTLIIIPIARIFGNKIFDAITSPQLLDMLVSIFEVIAIFILVIISLVIFYITLKNDLLYRYYNDFIYDVRQIKLFYAKQS